MQTTDKHREVSAVEFRKACGLFPTGVTVVTRRTGDGGAYGMTVSSFTSVSLDPPLILVCIDKRAGLILVAGHPERFAVNILNEGQEELARRFATLPDVKRFEGVNWDEGWEGVPIINDVVASLACQTEQVIAAGDHYILVGRVREIQHRPGRALVWCESQYHCLYVPAPRT